ncbi:MAG: DNA polymerase III subunit beta [Candidatus Gastranaerophilales bacterium]|nr:DNA polymerase III subunit beta [Candidatus Gastranaerophilales bacterium]
MLFTIDRDSLLNKLKIVEKITIPRGIQPVLANILFEATEGTLKLSATDLDISIITNTMASVKEEGKITLPAKKTFEIVSKLPDKPVDFSLNKDTNVVTITCGHSKFDIIGISAEEFPVLSTEEELSKKESIEIDMEPFVKSIKHTVYAAANYENRNIISGVFCNIADEKLEMAATDGNRLTRIIENIKNKDEKTAKIVIPSKTLQEFLRVSSFVAEEKVALHVDSAKVIIQTKSFLIISRLLEGEYPPYKQLIPAKTEKTAIVKRDDLISALERVSCMVNDRTSIVKFVFEEGKLLLKAETPDSGTSEDMIDVEYEGEELAIAFNYKYVLDSVKIMESKNTQIGLGGSLSATIFKPDSEEDYLCLIMPIQIR